MEPVIDFRHLETPADLTAAYDVMRALRPHLAGVDAFVAQLDRQRAEGYRLLAALQGPRVLGLSGYRHQTNLLYGRFVYVDDLVVDPALQRHQIGARLLDATRTIARESGCAHFVLDTGLHMPLAQRFYFRNGMLAKGMHFVEPLNALETTAR
ncbi:GNAT family N-acetyltransferase [Burkholderia glumae]